jgi:hypothetical protein
MRNWNVAVLLFSVLGFFGCAHEAKPVVEVSPALVAHTNAALRDLWVGHIFWIRNVVLDNATNNPQARDRAEKEVVANAKQLASTITPFYGEAASDKLFTLLADHYGAVKAYSEATVGEDKRKQDAALAALGANADEVAVFFSAANPYLQEDSVRGLIAAHGAHHVAQINQLHDKEYQHEAETWQVMRRHVYVIADAITLALVKQFPTKFS